MGTEVFILAASIAIVVLVLAIIFLFVFRWKIAFSTVHEGEIFHIVPSGVVDKNARSFRKLEKQLVWFEKNQNRLAEELTSKHIDIANQLVSSDNELRNDQERTSQALQAVLSTVRDLREETKILREEIQTQAQELERHRNGYDVDILSSALIPIANMHRVLLKDIKDEELPDEARNTLMLLEDNYLDVLETKGVQLAYPNVGDRYRDQKNIKHPPSKQPTLDPELAGRIAAVIQPAYELQTSARNVVLLPALVEIYSVMNADSELESATDVETEKAVAVAESEIEEENNG